MKMMMDSCGLIMTMEEFNDFRRLFFDNKSQFNIALGMVVDSLGEFFSDVRIEKCGQNRTEYRFETRISTGSFWWENRFAVEIYYDNETNTTEIYSSFSVLPYTISKGTVKKVDFLVRFIKPIHDHLTRLKKERK